MFDSTKWSAPIPKTGHTNGQRSKLLNLMGFREHRSLLVSASDCLLEVIYWWPSFVRTKFLCPPLLNCRTELVFNFAFSCNTLSYLMNNNDRFYFRCLTVVSVGLVACIRETPHCVASVKILLNFASKNSFPCRTYKKSVSGSNNMKLALTLSQLVLWSLT